MGEISSLIAELTCGDDSRAMTAIQQLVGCGQEALPVLANLLTSCYADVRWWATWALAEMADPRATHLLRQSLHDTDIAVRQAAALSLRQHPDPQAIPDLISALTEGDSILLHLVSVALAAIGKEAVPALLPVLENESRPARLAAARALATINDERSIPALYTALGDDSALVKHWANVGLERVVSDMILYNP